MKVLFPFVGDSVGGSHRSIIELHRELCKRNIASRILVHKKGPLSTLLDEIGISYDFLLLEKFAGDEPNIFLILYRSLANFNRIYRYVKINKISIVHGNDLRINFTWALPVKLSNSSYVWHQRTIMSTSILWRFSNLLADHFVTISEYVHQSLPKNIKKSKKTFVLNPFNIDNTYRRSLSRELIDSIYDISNKTILLGYVGRIVDWKNVDFLIRCFSECTNRIDIDMHLIIVGTGNGKYVNGLKELSLELGVSNAITFTGFSSKPNRILSAIDLMIAPSNSEPFGRTIVESMIQKTPVLSARGGGHLETIRHKKTGWLYSHNDIEDFVTQFQEIVDNRSMVNNVVDKAYAYACSKYTSTKHVGKVLQVYNQLN